MESNERLNGGATLPGTPSASSVKDMLTKQGLTTLPLWAHIFFTGVLPFGPLIPYIGPFFFVFFHTFGVNGINLLVSNSMSWAGAKALLNVILTKIGDYIGIMYSNRWWAKYLKAFLYYANPWYIFDWLQAVGANTGQNELFKKEGYKIPFANILADSALKPGSSKMTNKSIGFVAVTTDADGNSVRGEPTYGLLWSVPIAAILVLFMPALNLMVANLPAELQADISPGINKMFSWIGTITALVGGTVGATGLMGMVPNILSAMKPETLLAPAPVAAMSGGGGIPTIQQITEEMLNNKVDVQTGGSKDESTAFMGILGFTVFAGLALALVRRKQIP